jgi:signal peptidase I
VPPIGTAEDDVPPHLPSTSGPPSGAGDATATATVTPGTPPPEGRRHSGTRNVVEWVLVIGGALLVALIIKTFLLQAFYIPSRSMEPTLRIGDRVLVNKMSYHVHDINRGDIVVFERPPGESAGDIKDLIKRVIGLPGDTIEGIDGHVVINGRVLEEPYLPDGTITDNLPKQTVPDGMVFVMGDNRGDSRDSRYFGAISTDLIVGRAFVRVWPFTHLGFL